MMSTILPGCSFLSSPPSRIFSVEEFAADEQLMIQTAEDFSRGEVLPLVERLDSQEDGLMPSLIKRSGDLGLCGVDSPEAFGGLGLGKNLAARILEFMSLNGSFSVTYGITSGISQTGLALFGTDHQKRSYLPLLTSGEWIGAYALSEPNSGSDALAATTRADLRNGKYVLNGTKMWITNAKWANLFLVMAKVDGDKFSAFLVERNFPGVSIAREEHKLGLKGSSTARLLLENAEIPEENLLHEVGLGHQVAFNALNLGRFKLSSMSIGPARDAIGLAARYAIERRQFGASISSFGLTQKRFTLMAALFYVAESMIYRTGALIDEAFEAYSGSVDGNRRAAEEYSVECSICKVFSTEIEAFIVDEAFQVFGGYGFTEEFPIARHYRDARVSKIYEGTNEINRLFIADRYLKRVGEGRVSASVSDDSFIAHLLTKALENRPEGQVQTAGTSDLMTLAYAQQSASLRAIAHGGWREDLYRAALPWLNARAAEAFQLVTGQELLLPASPWMDWASVADQVYAAQGPLG